MENAIDFMTTSDPEMLHKMRESIVVILFSLAFLSAANRGSAVDEEITRGAMHLLRAAGCLLKAEQMLREGGEKRNV